MPQWELDGTRYRADVIVAARDGWDPAENWFRFAALPLRTDDPQLIERALEDVRLYLHKMTVMGGSLRPVASTLVDRIPEAGAVLLDPAARTTHLAGVREGLRHVRDRIQDAVGEMRAVPIEPSTSFARQSARPGHRGRRTGSLGRAGHHRAGARGARGRARSPAATSSATACAVLRFASVGEYLRARGLGADPSEQALAERDTVITPDPAVPS